MAHAIETELAAQGFEVKIVGVRKSLGHIHVIVAAQGDLRILGDDPFLECRQRDRDFDRGTGLGAARKRQFLVDHGQDAAIAGIDRNDRPIHVAERVDCSLADYRIFAGSHIAGKDVGSGVGTRGEALNVAMSARPVDSKSGMSRNRTMPAGDRDTVRNRAMWPRARALSCTWELCVWCTGWVGCVVLAQETVHTPESLRQRQAEKKKCT